MRLFATLSLAFVLAIASQAQSNAQFDHVDANSVEITGDLNQTTTLLDVTKRGSGAQEIVLRRTDAGNQNNEWRFAITGNSGALPGIAPGSFLLTPQQTSRDIVLRPVVLPTSGLSLATTPFVVKANGNVGIGTGSPQAKLEVSGGVLGQIQTGTFGSLAFGNQWVATGVSPFPIGQEATNPYGIRIQDDSDFALLQLVERPNGSKETTAGSKNAELAWGDDKDDTLNIVFVDGQNVRTQVAQFAISAFGDRLAEDGSRASTGVFSVQGEILSDALELRGGSDIAEPFAIADSPVLAPGMVVAIDPDVPGALRVADRAYDRTVAGIVSGAGGIRPALTLRQDGTIADGDHPVALTGRVYVHASTSNGPIRPGDMLTTSDTPGHAQRATDAGLMQGAVLGKAMTSLDEGTGLVLVLVSLQ